MEDYSKKNVVMIDNGISSAHAERLSRDVANLYYYTPCGNKGFPKFFEYAPGVGLGSVQKVNELDMWKQIKKADLIFFGDVGFGGMAQYFRDEGHAVFGAGQGERLEFERFKAKKVFDKIGLPVGHLVQIAGIDNLRKYLKKNKNVYVKHDIYRGSRESLHVKDYESAQLELLKLEQEFWPEKDDHLFIVEDEIENSIIEIGLDLLHNGKDFIKPYLLGVEHKAPYLGYFVDEIPMPMKLTAEKLSPLFKKLDYRGAFSDEEIVISKEKSFLIDATCRLAQPLSAIYTEAIKNYTEVIFKVAQGEDVTIIPEVSFVGCLPLNSEEAGNNWLEIDYPADLSNHIKPLYGCRYNGKLYAVKGFCTAVILIAWGDSLQSVVDQLKDLCNEVEGYDIEKETSSLDSIMEDFGKLKTELQIDI